MPNVDLNTITQGVEKNALIDLLVKLFGKLFPNKIVLDRLSSIEGSLAYNGQKIPTDTYTKAEIDELLENLPETVAEVITEQQMNQAIQSDKGWEN